MAGPAAAARGFTVSTILELAYGTGEGEVGFVPGAGDTMSWGPRSFAVTATAIFVLDDPKQRVLRFDRGTRRLDRTQEVRYATDLVASADGRVFVLSAATLELNVFDTQLVPLERRFVPITERGGMETTRNGIPRALENSSSSPTTTSRPRSPSPGPLCTVKFGRDDELTVLIGGAEPRSLRLRTVEGLGSATCLGADSAGRYYIVAEYIDPDSTAIRVTKQVEVFSSAALVGVIPIGIDYAATPVRDLGFLADGSVYHFRPLADRLLVQQWRPEALRPEGN